MTLIPSFRPNSDESSEVPAPVSKINSNGPSPLTSTGRRIRGWAPPARRNFTRALRGESVAVVIAKSGLMRPLGVTVREKLLEHIEADFAVIQRVTQLASLENPRGGNPTERQIEKALDLAGAARAGVGQDAHIGLTGELEFRQH